MSSPIFEEEGKAPAAGGMATAQQKIEKQARQLAYDTRYQVKKEIGEKKVNPAAMKRLLLQRLQKSTAAPNVKVRAKQMLLGEDYIGDVADFASGTVANALFKVFVEGNHQNAVEEIELEYLKELDENPNRKYKVRVTDKKTGNSYVRYATRDKITQLRANPNIQSVEMTEYGEPREGERKSGEDTARATGGGKKAKKDYDGDGKVESGAKEHAGAVHNAIQRKKGLPADGKDTSSVKEDYVSEAVMGQNTDLRRVASLERRSEKSAHSKWKKSAPGTTKKPRFSAVPHTSTAADDYANQKSREISWHDKKTKGKFIHGMVKNEEFLADAATEDQNDGKITGKGVNNYKGKNPVVRIMPEDPTAQRTNYQSGPRSVYAHYEAEGEVIAEKAMSKAQQRFMGMVYAAKKGEKPASPEVAVAAKGMTKKEAKKFAKTKHKGLPEKVEEGADCGCDESPKSSKKGEMDVRELPTKVNMIKNKMRAMGLKMSYEPEGEKIDEIAPLVAGGLALGGAALAGAAIKRAQDAAKSGVDAAKSGAKVNPTGGIAGAAYGLQKRKQETEKAMELLRQNYSPEGEVIDERTRERKGQPRPARDRAMEIVRKMPNYRVGGMTRSGKTIAQHEGERGVKKEPGAPTPKGETTADRLAQRKARKAGAEAIAQRHREEEQRRRRLG